MNTSEFEQAVLLDEVSEHGVEMVEPGAPGFRIPRERMDAVVLALECGGFVNVRAYEVQPGQDSARWKGGGQAASQRKERE